MSEPHGEPPDLRGSLAEDRTILAAERTYAAWLRTGLAFLGSGLVAQRFLIETLRSWQIRVIVFALLTCALASFAAAGWRDWRVRRRLPVAKVHLLPRWVTLAISGLLVALTLFAAVALGSM